MVWVVTVREVVFTVSAITAIISHAMSSLLLTHSAGILDGGNKLFATIGVTAGELTILSLPLILTFDMCWERSYTATILAEVVWMFTIGVLWVITGVKAMGITSGFFKNCTTGTAAFDSLCLDAQTLSIWSLVTGGLLLAYGAALTGFAVSQGGDAWTNWKLKVKRK
ncbi:uncharacterized protein BXZ73DRAFT_104595 [Epithele typhae]|uniref:uncharacterized protein n=1 Tax=Epithele typhae TaxID=378194 RepID=UPI0020072B8E|nr:uncharacterized protein BXZ73DRAFT_104595 [Epithele typhae]KAH9920861.1 hypothetical protein BXZ73DRAFT_104595 [Epithele typhae]